MSDGEVCASTGTGDLEPYSSQYEGYMGNGGNTLDRWYHRAAVVVWPRGQAFANRAEASPAWALDELAGLVTAGDAAGARTAVTTLAPFWDKAVRGQPPPRRLSKKVGGLQRRSEVAARAVQKKRELALAR